MIKNKADLKFYLEEDRKALGIKQIKPPLLGAEIWKFQRSLRKLEYYTNIQGGISKKFKKTFWNVINHYQGLRLGFTIPPNCFGPGLNIHHYGYIVVNANARIGANCNIQQGVNIGQNHDETEVPTIGDNVYIGPGAKIFGKITIANGIAIGANSVVNKSFFDENVSIAGIPATIIGKRKI